MNGNPFYVQPGNNLLPGLTALSGSVRNYGEVRKENKLKEKFEAIKQGAMKAYQSGDPDMMAEYAIQNPEISQTLMLMANFRDERTKDNYLDSAYSVIADPSPESVERFTKARQSFLKSQGQTDDDMPYTNTFLEKYNANSEQAINNLKMEVAGIDPERWKKFREALGPVKGERTSNIKDIEYYEYLKKTDPEMAEKFSSLIELSGKSAAPTDIDDFVADADAESIRLTGKGLTPGNKNKARLEFKRAQEREVRATRLAEREVEAETAEKIKYNEKLGTRLAEIATQADLIKAKGEISPAEKKNTAKNRMTGNLAKLANHYITLDSTGAMLNVDNTTFENIMAATRASEVGQMFGRITGSNEQSIRSAIKKIKPLLIQDIRQSTDMSARGLDSEKELEFYLQAATDEKTDIQSNISAIVVLDEAYGTGNVASELRNLADESLIMRISNEGQAILNRTRVKTINTQEEYDALPSGATFIENGKTYRKP